MKNELSVPCVLTAPHPCNYLPDQSARTLFVDKGKIHLSTNIIYSNLIDQGFRRSGQDIYRPLCDQCQACIPIRIPVATFQPSRRQRRTFNHYAKWVVVQKPANFSSAHFSLYCRYMQSRHIDKHTASPNEKDYEAFLCRDNPMTSMHEFWLNENLIAVTVTDYLPQGLSAVYTFFDPDYAKLSPGSFAILWLIQRTQQLNLAYLYLGYWIANSQKMAYKSEYQPAEIYYQQQWQPIPNR